MKLTVCCKLCGRVISAIERDQDFNDADILEHEQSSSCEIDGPVQTFDDNGNPIPMDFSNIVAVKTKNS